MATDINSLFDRVKEAFAPVTDALKSLPTMDMPESAREFVRKTASTAKERAAEAFADGEQVTAAIETAVAGGVSEAAKIGRNIQQAIHQDAEAFFDGIGRLASARSLSEAVQVQSDLVRAHGEAMISRTKAATEYVGGLVANGAKTVQDNFAKASNEASGTPV
jgi:phasin